MKKYISSLFLIIILLIIIELIIYFFMSGINKNKKANVCINNNCFDVELAKTEKERSVGLMFREEMAENEGMFFIFEKPGNYGFWMKNTLIPLDIIWIDEDNKIVFMQKSAQPCKEGEDCKSINPNTVAKYVLEINAGLTDKLGLKEGDAINFLY